MLLRRGCVFDKLTYSKGSFGAIYQSEALEGALPKNQNSPQKVPYGLHTELLSGTSFTMPRSQNRYSWLYRVRPSVQHVPQTFVPFTTRSGTFVSPPFDTADFTPEAYRFKPKPMSSQPTDFIDGLFTVAGNGGGPVTGVTEGAAAHVYAINSSMTRRVFRNQDGDMLFVPQDGDIVIQTEFGDLEVAQSEIALIPRGITFRVHLQDGVKEARGYVLENFGAPFVIPDMGPIGISSGLAHPRHFVAPTASFADAHANKLELIAKLNGKMFHGPLQWNPFDVVAWYGSYVPVKYDLRLFMPINAVGFDHPDPSIGCVLQSPTAVPGLSNIDFVIFPPKWMVSENTFRPPWFHRNMMSEFMGLIKGRYDAKPAEGFVPGGSSIHNQFSPHGPDGEATSHAINEDTVKHTRYENTLAFMWESNKVWVPTTDAIAKIMDNDYVKCWENIPKTFKEDAEVPSHPLPFKP
jgi:homogentisate 1,2-dioxygenase